MSSYEVWLTNDTGVRLANPVTNTSLLDDFLWLQCSHIVNDVGRLQISLPATFDITLLRPDRQIQVWRQPTGGVLSLWRSYFIRRWRLSTRGSREEIIVIGQDSNIILNWRIVAYADGESESVKEALEADDMMKEIVDENMVSATDTDRNYAQMSVQGNLTAGPQLTQRFAWRNVLETCKRISEAAREEGTEVWFDVVPNIIAEDSITYRFETFTGQPGADRTSGNNRTVFDQERGNLEDPFLDEDYTREVNVIYALGQGELDNRREEEIEDAVRSAASSWGRKEGYADARLETDATGTQDAGRARLRELRGRIRFGGRPQDTAGTRFGRDWDFGDKVIARYRGQEFEPIIEAVQITVRAGVETIDARLDFER